LLDVCLRTIAYLCRTVTYIFLKFCRNNHSHRYTRTHTGIKDHSLANQLCIMASAALI
jgi:hypothetical protein